MRLSPRPDDTIMTRDEVASWLRVKPRQVERLGVPCIPLGRKTLRYLRADVLAQAYVTKGAEKKYRATDAGIQALGPRSTRGPSLVQESESRLVHRAGGCITPAMDQDQNGEAA